MLQWLLVCMLDGPIKATLLWPLAIMQDIGFNSPLHWQLAVRRVSVTKGPMQRLLDQMLDVLIWEPMLWLLAVEQARAVYQ
jgi:hypothetical protein